MADINKLISELTTQEKIAMVSGLTAWSIPGCDRLGIPEWTVSDGPIGVRGRGFTPALCLPSASAWASTFDTALVSEMGSAIAAEAKDRAVDMVLGPTVNIHRHPLGGRHFECYSEDPYLTTRVAVAYISAVQDGGIGSCIKHYVANDQEFERFTVDIEVGERALREIYMPPFEAAVREAGVWGVMGAYNFVNGVQACENAGLLIDVLKEEWGFDGLVVSDWSAIKGTVGPAVGGLDLEMPGPGRWWGKGRLEKAVADGEVPESAIDEKVRRILGFLDWAGLIDRSGEPPKEASVDRPEARDVARRAAVESIVLLKNQAGALPLEPEKLSRVALIGPNAMVTSLLGGGSAVVNPHHKTNILDSLESRLAGKTDLVYAEGTTIKRDFDNFDNALLGDDRVTLEFFDGSSFEGEPVKTETGQGPMSIWLGANWPEGLRQFSVRASVSLTPDVSGPWRLGGAAFGYTRLFLDGELIADSDEDRFSSGLAMWGTSSRVTLEAGRTYDLVQEARPHAGGFEVMTYRIGGQYDPDRPELIDQAEAAARDADAAIVVVGTSAEYECEDEDRRTLALPGNQDELVRRVAGANPRTIVVSNTGSPVLMPWIDEVAAILQVWFPGQEGGDAIADVLLGADDPGGRLPTSWPKRLEDTPAFDFYPGENGKMRYGEGIFVGYRWYDSKKIQPLWPFGHGLSYASFDWAEPVVGETADLVSVSAQITNTSDRRGSEVVQCYIAPPEGSVERPPKELKGFAKVKLEPGESATARIELPRQAFARWDETEHDWVVDEGVYQILLGASSSDIRGQASLKID